MTLSPPLRPLRVTRKKPIARDIHLLELQDPSGAILPAFSAGAHLPVQVPTGAMRHYSMCGDPQEAGAYQIAVKREATGRGGSISLIDGVHAGDTLMVGEPDNQFALSDKARSFILIAGGIGVTPMLAMIHQLRAEGRRPFKLYYLARDPESTAFLETLGAPELADQVLIHHDHRDPTRSLDLWPVLEKSVSGAHLYCCGPKGLMDNVRDMSGHWPTSAVHFESFGADTHPRDDDQAFEVVLRRSGKQLTVGPRQSLLDALRGNGLQVPSSCESGTCGSCKVGLLEGQADHRDYVLLPEEHATHFMPCVSRAQGGGPLVLDL